MTKEEAVEYKNRWDLIKQARIQEVRRMSLVQKIHDLELLFEFGETRGWSRPEGGESWDYWRRLKELSHV